MKIRHRFKDLLLMALFFGFVISCSKEDAVNDINTISIELVNSQQDVKLSSVTGESLEIIVLESKEECLIGQIDKIIVDNGYIFILDIYQTAALYMFNKDGTFIRKIGNPGPGPHEYQRPYDFMVKEETVEILDNGKSVITYDLLGNFIRRDNLDSFSALKFINVGEGVNAFISGGRHDNLLITDANYNVKDSYFPYRSPEADKVLINPLFQITNTKSIVYRRNLHDTLYIISNEGRIIPYKYINYGTKAIGKSGLLSGGDIDRNINTLKAEYCLTRFYFETSESHFLAFTYGDVIWINLGSKGQTRTFRYSDMRNDITFENQSYPIGVTNDKIIYKVEPYHLIEAFSKNENANSSKHHMQMKAVVEKLGAEDNPVLLLLKLEFDEEE